MFNPDRFQESHHEHVFRLTGSPRRNVFMGASMRRVKICFCQSKTRPVAREKRAHQGIN